MREGGGGGWHSFGWMARLYIFSDGMNQIQCHPRRRPGGGRVGVLMTPDFWYTRKLREPVFQNIIILLFSPVSIFLRGLSGGGDLCVCFFFLLVFYFFFLFFFWGLTEKKG